eukprot:CAMPEP_0202905560 /NCGR_PEP_ID=MMETSP1392-20130828/34877_1 /ASSEMBLY_ACC=CAM_ASM_000868 /TAXON_ID=225041 /ORGANISM="Chlamydomonas chlamydogama, Strain SAG 11-48b" /LENGTH=53 /DNA_ID=CAMNT_0049593705 /DNA_START=459 /DNA_END=620 /DNA_ORIENTATION=-
MHTAAAGKAVRLAALPAGACGAHELCMGSMPGIIGKLSHAVDQVVLYVGLHMI